MPGFGTMPRPFLIALLALAFLATASTGPARAVVSGFHVVPNAISPNGDGVRDSTTLLWNLDGPADCVRISITGSGTGGTLVRRFLLGPRPAGPDSIVWDGTDSTGVLVPDRLYGIVIHQLADSCNGNILSAGQATVLVDVGVPPLPTFDHGDTLVVRSQFKLLGTAATSDTVALFRDGTRIDTVATVTDARFTFDVVLLEGDNRYSVQGWDRAGNLSPQTLPINVFFRNAPDIGIVSAIPGAFSPNGDGRADSTRMQLSLDAPTTRLVVEARRGQAPAIGIPDGTIPVALLYDGPAPAGPSSFPWDGTDSTGTITVDGEYVLVAQADSVLADGTPAPSVRRSYARVVLDTVAPPAPVVDPPPALRSLRTQVVLNVVLLQTDSLRIFRDGALLQTDDVEISLIPAVSVHEVPLHLGSNQIALQAIDFAGNLSALAGPYTVVFETPIGFHAPERFGRGEAFGVNLESPASSVVIDLFTLRGTPVRQLKATGSAVHFELPWDLKDVAGNFVGDGPYLARLRVSYANGTGAETKAAIVVVK